MTPLIAFMRGLFFGALATVLALIHFGLLFGEVCP